MTKLGKKRIKTSRNSPVIHLKPGKDNTKAKPEIQDGIEPRIRMKSPDLNLIVSRMSSKIGLDLQSNN